MSLYAVAMVSTFTFLEALSMYVNSKTTAGKNSLQVLMWAINLQI